MRAYIGTKIILAEPMDEAKAVMAGFARNRIGVIHEDGTSDPGYKVGTQ